MKRYLLLISLSIVMINVGLVAQPYHIGDVYTAPDMSQGIVYYLFPDGSGGLVVALNDASEGCIWGDDIDVPGLTNRSFYSNTNYHQLQDDTSGYSNTLTMREAYQNGNSAAWVVDFDNGWVLPSPWQLRLLYGRLAFIYNSLVQNGGTSLQNGFYWCSTEYSSTAAWALSSYGGSFATRDKNNESRVRAVRSFNYYDDGISYLWSTGATTSSIMVSPTQTTGYTVTVTTNGGFTDTEEQTIVVGGGSYSEFTVATNEPYTWDGVMYDQSGDYIRSYPIAGGCDSILILHLTVTITPQVNVVATDDTICVGDEITLAAEVWNDTSFVINPELPVVFVGDILCTDGTIVKASDYAVSGKTAMGVVFYVDNTGEHGWAVHLQDQGTGSIWTPAGYFVDISTLTNYANSRNAVTDLNGYSNTQKIRNVGSATTYPAAFVVDFANGWYLPAAGQMRILFDAIMTVNASLQIVGGTPFSMDSSFTYWSSTEYNQTNAWHLRNDGSIYASGKSGDLMVRSARDF